jgi:hypothetical protein
MSAAARGGAGRAGAPFAVMCRKLSRPLRVLNPACTRAHRVSSYDSNCSGSTDLALLSSMVAASAVFTAVIRSVPAPGTTISLPACAAPTPVSPRGAGWAEAARAHAPHALAFGFDHRR